MIDAHFHRNVYDTFLAVDGKEYRFYGVHPWQCAIGTIAPPGNAGEVGAQSSRLRVLLESDPHAGVGEIGLDRLKTREVSPVQREMFARQLALASELHRPAVLHGAKCWGEVVKACKPHAGKIPAFLFHGFSRSGGLLPDICALNGFVSVGPAVLNDHAVNYRELVKEIPLERLLVETDVDVGRCDGEGAAATPERDGEGAAATPSAEAVLKGTAAVRGMDAAELEGIIVANARRFVESLA